MSGDYDALVIGGGPGGTTAATLMSRGGLRVLLLEKEHFPRFHVGESLLPYNGPIFQELGVLKQIEAAGFPRKKGAQFHLGNGSKGLKLVFQNGRFTRETSAFQVERSKLDKILLDNCRGRGVDVREGWTAGRFSQDDEGVSLETRNEDNAVQTFRSRFLIDASGRNNCTGTQEGLRIVHPSLKKIALFGHFEDVFVDEGSAGGDTVIVRLENKWFWVIPIGGKVSVGLVMDQEEFAKTGRTATDEFKYWCQQSTQMRSRMRNAKAVRTIQATSDFSYYNRRLVGARLLRVGDAAGFMDPIFSAGVYLAMYSGSLAARTVIDCLSAPGSEQRKLRLYERKVFQAMKCYWEMVEHFYTAPFMELFMEPRPKFDLPDAIVAILAGELEGGWALEVRRRIFFMLVKIQKRWSLVPRLSYAEPPETANRAGTRSDP